MFCVCDLEMSPVRRPCSTGGSAQVGGGAIKMGTFDVVAEIPFTDVSDTIRKHYRLSHRDRCVDQRSQKNKTPDRSDRFPYYNRFLRLEYCFFNSSST
jgi:hypothetical protein